jgi:SET domain-containing protein
MDNDLFIDGEDAGDKSSWCRFMNHASDTNTCNVETRCTRLIIGDIGDIGGKVLQPRLCFVAIRDIECGEELSYDYGDSFWDY